MKPNMTAKLIFVLITVASIFVAWAVVQSFDRTSVTTQKGEQSLPEQAAHEAHTKSR